MIFRTIDVEDTNKKLCCGYFKFSLSLVKASSFKDKPTSENFQNNLAALMHEAWNLQTNSNVEQYVCVTFQMSVFCLDIFKFCQALWRAIYLKPWQFSRGAGPGSSSGFHFQQSGIYFSQCFNQHASCLISQKFEALV